MKHVEYCKKYNDKGEEIMDPTPCEVPTGFHRPPSLQERIKMLVRSENLRLAAEAAGNETFEEANDFDIDDELDRSIPFEDGSPYEEKTLGDFDQEIVMEQKLRAKRATPPSQPAPAVKKTKKVAQKPVVEDTEDDDLE